MNDLTKSEGVSLLNLILPKESVVSVSEAITNAGAKGVFQISARGSVLNEGGFFQKMFPPPAPEQHLLQALVPDDKIENVTDVAVKTGSLNKVGSGAVFSISCIDAHVSSTRKFPQKSITVTRMPLPPIWRQSVAFAKKASPKTLPPLHCKWRRWSDGHFW